MRIATTACPAGRSPSSPSPHHRRARSGPDAHQGILAAAPQAPAGGRRQSRRADVSIRELLGHEDIDIDTVDTGEDALEALEYRQAFDCVVLDLRLPDMTGFEVLEKMRDTPSLQRPARRRVYRPRLTPEEDAQLHTLARSVVVKDVESPERLLDETALFLHRVVADLPAEKQQMLDRLHRSDDALVGKKVLVVDDDVRNIFALSSVLERRGMNVLSAGTGREAIAHYGIHARSGHRPDGHHDAGDGRLRDHAGDPPESHPCAGLPIIALPPRP